MFKDKLNYKIINLSALMLLLYIGVSNISIWWGLLSKIISILSPFIIGFSFAYAFTPLVKWLQKKGINKTFSIIIVVFGIIFIILALLAITLPMLYDQLSLLIKMLIEVFNNISDKFDINLGTFEIKITDFLNDILKDLGGMASTTTMGIMSKSVDLVSKLIVGFVGFVYFLIDMDKIRSHVREFLENNSKKSLRYFKMMDDEISNYLKGLELFMFIQLVEYSIIFLVIGHPNWLILGLLACLTTVIPYFGGLITNLIALVLASVVSPTLVILTTIVCLIFPQLDGYVISPKVYGKTNNVSPLITIMAVSVGGTLGGVVGIIVALPIYLLLRNTYYFFKKDLKKGMVIVKKNI